MLNHVYTYIPLLIDGVSEHFNNQNCHIFSIVFTSVYLTTVVEGLSSRTGLVKQGWSCIKTFFSFIYCHLSHRHVVLDTHTLLLQMWIRHHNLIWKNLINSGLCGCYQVSFWASEKNQTDHSPGEGKDVSLLLFWFQLAYTLRHFNIFFLLS